MARKLPPLYPEFMFMASRDILRGLERGRKYGTIARARVPAPVWLLYEPEDIEQVLAKKNKSFRKGIVEQNSLAFMGQGLLTSDGGFWKKQRRLEQPAFHKKKIEGYAERYWAGGYRPSRTCQSCAGQTPSSRRRYAFIRRSTPSPARPPKTWR